MESPIPDLICPACGYDLRAISSERCPECGTPIDRAAMSVSTIPWEHRKTIGYIRAYWRTLILATLRIRKLGAEINRPVNWRDANRFRWVTVGVASLAPVCLYLFITLSANAPRLFDPLPLITKRFDPFPSHADLVLPYAAGITRWGVPALAIIFWMALISEVAGDWFDTRASSPTLRDRARAISLYACAPMAWLVLPFVLGSVALAMLIKADPDVIDEYHIVFIAWSAVALWLVLAIVFWINLLRLLRYTVRPSRTRRISAALGLPLMWIATGLIAGGLFSWVIGFVWLMIDSLR